MPRLTKEERQERKRLREEEEARAEEMFPGVRICQYRGENRQFFLQIYMPPLYDWLEIRCLGEWFKPERDAHSDVYSARIDLDSPQKLAELIRALACRYNRMVNDLNEVVAKVGTISQADEIDECVAEEAKR